MNERSTDIVAATDLAVEMPPGTETGIQHGTFFKVSCVPRFKVVDSF
ncbi:MAG: hypothetical protein OXG15_06265 [Gammaproteobacteria bacterium]|nr:hypothetical protein [Gammaproteobacteria bacterium]